MRHEPACNVACDERGHHLLSSGPFGEPFSHQEPADCADCADVAAVSGVAGNPEEAGEND